MTYEDLQDTMMKIVDRTEIDIKNLIEQYNKKARNGQIKTIDGELEDAHEIDDDDLNYFSNEIIDFLKIVEQTNDINLSEIEPLYHAPENSLKAREDKVDEDPKNDGINSAPEHNGEHFIVPKVID